MSCRHSELPTADAAARKARGYLIRSGWRRIPTPSWIKTTLYLYGHNVRVWYQSVDALWYSSAGSRLPRMVMVHDPGGRRPDDCFFSTDLTLKPSTDTRSLCSAPATGGLLPRCETVP